MHDYLGTVAAQARGTYEPKHRGEPKPDPAPVVIETTDSAARVLRGPENGAGVLFVPPGTQLLTFPLDQQP